MNKHLDKPLNLFVRLGLTLLTFILTLGGSVVSAQSSVLLGVQLGVNDYDAASLGRTLTLYVRYFSGDPTMEICSSVDPQDVTLTLALPEGANLLSETNGSGVYDPATNSVNWNLGPLDRLSYCFGAFIYVTIQVNPAIPDGTPLTASSSINTSTPGDDPADNTDSAEFQGGMLPLEVEFEGANASCQAGGTSDSNSDGQALICSDFDLGGYPNGLPSKAVVALDSMNLPPPRLLGKLTSSSKGYLYGPRLGFVGSARAGFGYSPNDTFYVGLPASAGADLSQDLIVHNPNPFDVALRVRYDSYGHVICSNYNSGFFGNAFVEDTLPGLDCGDNIRRSASGILRQDCDGNSNTCERVISIDGDTAEETIFSELARVPASGTRNIDSIFQGYAGGDATINEHLSYTTVKLGLARFSGLSQVRIGLADAQSGAHTNALRIQAASPVDLLITNPEGDRVGRGPDEEPPAIGEGDEVLLSEAILNEIPGAQYSGPWTEPETIMIGLPESGAYQLEMTGTGDGPYTLSFETLNDNGQTISQHTISGEVSAGSLITETFTLEASGFISTVTSSLVYLPFVIR